MIYKMGIVTGFAIEFELPEKKLKKLLRSLSH